MTRTLRGAWARRRELAPVAALAAALVASVTACLAEGRVAGDATLAAPLVLLGAVALVAPARSVAAERRDDAALARLRGLGGARLVGQLLAEPVLALVAGGLVGLGVAAAFWPGSVAAGGLVLLVVAGFGALAVAVALAVGMRERLADQVSRVARPRASSSAATFAGLVSLAAAGYAVFAARQSTVPPRWLVDSAPALLGLALGQVLVWLLRGASRAAVARSAASRTGVFLATRRLARRAGSLTPLALLVAAAVTATVAATAAASAYDWVDQAARVRAGAPVQVPLDGVGAARALTLTHRLDPAGRWLMAAVVLPPGEGGRRTVLVDSPRLARVSGAVLAGTGAAAVARLVPDLGHEPGVRAGRAHGSPSVARGDVLGLRGRVTGRPSAWLTVRVDYVTAADYVTTGTVGTRPDGHGLVAARVRLPGCSRGCVPTALTIDVAGDATGTLSMRSLGFGGLDLLRVFGLPAAISLSNPPSGLRPVRASRPVPAIGTPGTTSGRAPGATSRTVGALRVQGPDGTERSAAPRGRVAALPLVGTRGVLADLGTALAGALPTSPAAQVLVLARADTPSTMLSRLPGTPVRLAQVHRRVAAASGAARGGAALLTGLCALLVTAIALFAGVARQRRELASETAALRVTGLPLERLRSSVRVELLACGAAAAVGVGLGSWLAVGLLLARLRLLTVPADAVAPDGGARPLLLVAGSLVALGIVVLVVGLGRVVRERASRPALLREEGVL